MPNVNNLMYLGCCLESRIYLNPNTDYNNVLKLNYIIL